MAGFLVASPKLFAAAGLSVWGGPVGRHQGGRQCRRPGQPHSGKAQEEVAEILRETAETDQAEDHQHGPARGDELPAELASPTGRLARLQQAKALLETDAAERQRRTSSGSPSWPPRPGPGQATPGGHQAPTP